MMRSRNFLNILFALLSFAPINSYAQSSERIRNSIFETIQSNGEIKGYDIEVEARRGVVWLRGQVASEANREQIATIARKTRGVREVNNELQIAAASSHNTPELARTVQEKIRPFLNSTNHAVTIANQGAVVTLSGFVGSKAIQAKVEKAAKTVPGVEEVISRLEVNRPPDDVIAQRIKSSIQSTPGIRIENLDVLVKDGVATLRGTGRTHLDTDHALSLALMVDGVEDIKSDFKSQK
jgi:hyperosmotically inducible protein